MVSSTFCGTTDSRMGACCSALFPDEPPRVYLINVEDGSITQKRKDQLSPFANLSTSFDISKLSHRAGPLCTLVVPMTSPEGLKPFVDPDAQLLKPLRQHELFHGGEQMLGAFFCEITHTDNGNTNNNTF